MMKINLKTLCFMPLLTASLFTVVVPSFIAMSAHAHASSHATQSKTKTIGGLRYKLTVPKPLIAGKQKWTLNLSGNKAENQASSFEAMITMADGMKNKVKVTPKGKGVFELSTELTMSGDWQLILKNKPAKESIKFELTVMGNSHTGHAM